MFPSNIVLDRGPSPPTGRRDLGIGTPVRSGAAYRQITLAFYNMMIVIKWNDHRYY